jgi:uncharacterized damage-inducible protein DinB
LLELFLYNWQVRKDWFEWCETISEEELTKTRVGGMGSILHNLYHVISCEQLWIAHMLGEPVITKDLKTVTTLNEVIDFANETKLITEKFMKSWNADIENKTLQLEGRNGQNYTFTYGKVMRHIITHEIHHIGQLSVWSRQMDRKPVSSDLIFRDYI